MDLRHSVARAMVFEEAPCGVDAAPAPADQPERAHAVALADARAALATAVLAEPQGIAAGLRNLEGLAHRGRLRGRALLVERPVPGWVDSHVRALHAHAGCRLRAIEPPLPEACGDLSRALARLPWSGEWLVRVLEGMPDPVGSRARELAAAWQVRRNAFVEAHLGLVTFVVLRHGSLSGLAREDLIQEGRLALCRAVERYDPERGPRFSSYAVLVIRHAMAQHVRRMGVGPEAPRGPVPTVSGISPVPVDPGHGVGRRRVPRPVSLDAPLDDGTSLAERLSDTERLGPDVAAGHVLARERLWEALAALPTEVERIVTLHWGLDGSPRRSIPSVARRVGRTPAEVEAVLRDALRVLRDLVARPPRAIGPRRWRALRPSRPIGGLPRDPGAHR